MATPSIPNNVAVLEDDLNTNSSGNNESNSNSQDGGSSNSGDQSNNNNINSNSGSRIIHIRLRPDQLQSAPENFSMVVDGVYRSSFPRPENFPFLEKMKLKSILVLIPEPYPDENVAFLKANGINFFQVGMSGNKEPFINVSYATITKALEVVLNPANHPLLIHCNRGKHRTGCLVGCIRRLQNWSLTMIFDEYRRFSFPKARPLDQQLIELYDDTEIYIKAVENDWLPLSW